MGKKERDIINERLSSLAPNQRLFRINAGMGWAGKCVRHGDIIIIKNPYPLHAAPEGWPDLCGFESIEISQEMIGHRVAIFVGEEVKTPGTRTTSRQSAFGELIQRMGGIFRILN